ncbi:MAG: hypothetical protein V9F04_17165 [Dermatophilaceae bacterium]
MNASGSVSGIAQGDAGRPPLEQPLPRHDLLLATELALRER